MEKRKTSNIPLNEEINIWYKTNNIIYEKNELYYDFFSSLFDVIEDSYLGEDVINDKKVISDHFKWCYNNVIESFGKENIVFASSGPLHDYLWIFFYESFYKDSSEKNVKNLSEFFNNLFNFTGVKTKKEMDTYKFLYKLFEMALKN